MSHVVLAALASAVATLLLCNYAQPVAARLGLIDDPRNKPHGLHAAPTPLIGGLAIVLPWLLAGAATLLAVPHETQPLIPVLSWKGLGFIAFFLALGVIDDRRGLSVSARLLAKTLAYVVVVSSTAALSISQLKIPSLGIAWDTSLVAAPFTVLCLVALNNAVNMCDGRNGLVIGMVIVWLVSLLFHIPLLGEPLVLILPGAAVLTGWYNWHGRLFLGDGGAYALSTLVGMLAIWAHQLPQTQGGLTSTQLATFFAIPALDMNSP